MTSLEEYYTDEMYLPMVNGASEGCFLTGILMILSGIKGCAWWNSYLGPW